MIVAWMSYTVLVSVLLFAGAAAAEFVCRALGWPTRTVWITALGLSAALSTRALVLSTQPSMPQAMQSVTVLAPARTVAAAIVPAEPGLLSNARAALDFPGRAVASMGRTPSFGTDRVMAIALIATAIGGLAYLTLVVLRIRRIARTLEARDLNGRQVFVSDELGPALLGVVRPRIVIPRWVFSLSDAERRVILAHEQQHADAYDPALLAGAALLLAVAPWNVALWVMFARLRLAIEVDCDRRVLASHRDARRYGDLLVTVYERTASAGMQLAFVARPSHLERRIRRLIDRAPRLASGRGVAALAAAVALVAAACGTSTPTQSARDSVGGDGTSRAVRGATVVGAIPRCIQPGQFPSLPLQQVKDATGKLQYKFDATKYYSELKAWARERHPDVWADSLGPKRIIGFVLDEHCAVLRDTVLVDDVALGARGNAFFSKVFGDTSQFTQSKGMDFLMYPAKPRGSRLKLAYAVQPSAAWRARAARTACGIGLRFDERCRRNGPLELRMMDSVHALVAIRGFRAPNKPVDDLFLVTLSRPNAVLATQSMQHGIIGFQSGALYVEDFLAREPRIWLGTATSPGLVDQRSFRGISIIDDIVGIAHHTGVPLTLEQVARLRPAARCALPGSCYEVDGQSIEFP